MRTVLSILAVMTTVAVFGITTDQWVGNGTAQAQSRGKRQRVLPKLHQRSPMAGRAMSAILSG